MVIWPWLRLLQEHNLQRVYESQHAGMVFQNPGSSPDRDTCFSHQQKSSFQLKDPLASGSSTSPPLDHEHHTK